MGLPVLILGFSGSGKSASMRNFASDEISLVNVNGKPLPFRTKFSSKINSDSYSDILQFMRSQGNKIIVIDDCQYLMANEYMRRAKESGYQKFTDIGKNFWELVKAVELLPEDVVVYFLAHIETGDDGRQKMKTVGRMLDEKISVEGMFTIVLKTVVVDGKYFFATQTDGADTCKSPIGLFGEQLIPNDLKLVDETIRTYYEFVEGHRCADCGELIMPAAGRTAEQLAEASTTKFGRKLCISCGKKAAGNAAQTVSE